MGVEWPAAKFLPGMEIVSDSPDSQNACMTMGSVRAMSAGTIVA